MIRRIEISGINYEVKDDLKKYITRKIGKLDKYLPRKRRKNVHVEVRLRQPNESYGNKYECEVMLHVPDELLTAKDSTMNMFAAVDIVEEKLKNQLAKYKAKHANQEAKGGGWRGRLKRRGGLTLATNPIEPEDEEVL